MPRSRLAEAVASKSPDYIPPPTKETKPQPEPVKPKVVFRGTAVFTDGETLHLSENLLFKKHITSGAIGLRRKFRIIIIEHNAKR